MSRLPEKRDLDAEVFAPPYTHPVDRGDVPVDRLPADGAMPDVAKRLVMDELMLDGNPRMNLATFVSTWMEPQAQELIVETLDRNLVDRDEYPATTELERRCVNIIAQLFHAPGLDERDAIGVSTLGSSEAVMLAGLAMLWRWRARQVDGSSRRPNLVMGTNVQVVWKKFCRYWDVEPREVPVELGRYTLGPESVAGAIDDDTIGVVATMGTVFSGEYEPIEAIQDAVVAGNRTHGRSVPVHVDAATGGFIAPFLDPDIRWDFRLPNVHSINVSGHKYGLVYPGLGFVVWREPEDLPDDLVFTVDYLGGEMSTFTLNFSRPGSLVVGQYYNFLRLGHYGYRRIMRTLRTTAGRLAEAIAEIGPFELVRRGDEIPVVTFSVGDGVPYSAFDLAERMRMNGWLIPAYTMPADADDITVLRIVVREGFTHNLGAHLVRDLRAAHEVLAENPPVKSASRAGFRH